MKKLILGLVAVLSLMSVVNVYAGPVSQSLIDAQEAFRRKDASTTVAKLKSALMEHNNHPLVVAKSTKMLSALQSKGLLSYVKTDWAVPSAFEVLKIEVRRKYNQEAGRVRFQLHASGGVTAGSTLEQFQVIRYPDKVIIDKQAKIGEWENEMWGTTQGFWSLGDRVNQPIEEGLYLINIKLKDQPVVNGWVILQNLNSSADLVIEKPHVNQELTTANPKISWKKFKSPEYQEGEKRRLRVVVVDDVETWVKDVFAASFKKSAPETTSYQVGDTKTPDEFEGSSSLPPGPYRLTVTAYEQSMFGNLTVGRGISTTIPFKVK